jgi:hypothetical protein
VTHLQGIPPAKDGGNDGYVPHPAKALRHRHRGASGGRGGGAVEEGGTKCSSTLVFAMVLSCGVRPDQLERVVSEKAVAPLQLTKTPPPN